MYPLGGHSKFSVDLWSEIGFTLKQTWQWYICTTDTLTHTVHHVIHTASLQTILPHHCHTSICWPHVLFFSCSYSSYLLLSDCMWAVAFIWFLLVKPPEIVGGTTRNLWLHLYWHIGLWDWTKLCMKFMHKARRSWVKGTSCTSSHWICAEMHVIPTAKIGFDLKD